MHFIFVHSILIVLTFLTDGSSSGEMEELVGGQRFIRLAIDVSLCFYVACKLCGVQHTICINVCLRKVIDRVTCSCTKPRVAISGVRTICCNRLPWHPCALSQWLGCACWALQLLVKTKLKHQKRMFWELCMRPYAYKSPVVLLFLMAPHHRPHFQSM